MTIRDYDPRCEDLAIEKRLRDHLKRDPEYLERPRQVTNDAAYNPGDRTEEQRLLDEAAPMFCPDCGPHVKIDEDGCCAMCGRDAFEGREAWLESERERLLDEVKKYWGKSRIYSEMAYKWRERCIAGGLAKSDERIEATEYQGYEARISELEAQLAERDKRLENEREAHLVHADALRSTLRGVTEELRAANASRDSLREQVRLWEATRDDGRACAEFCRNWYGNGRTKPGEQGYGHGQAGERYLASLPAPVAPEPAESLAKGGR